VIALGWGATWLRLVSATVLSAFSLCFALPALVLRLIASLPSASSNYVLAQRYPADADRVSAGIVFSTVIRAVTVPWVGWRMVGP
jgi:predicted permease